MKVWLLALCLGGIVTVQAQDWDRADRSTRRLAPSAFAGLPAEVREELERLECTVPQPFTAEKPANVINGRFTSPRQTDWAILCSRQRRSSVLVFRGGSVAAVAEIASEPDVTSLQVIDGNGAIGYSRTLQWPTPTTSATGMSRRAAQDRLSLIMTASMTCSSRRVRWSGTGIKVVGSDCRGPAD